MYCKQHGTTDSEIIFLMDKISRRYKSFSHTR